MIAYITYNHLDAVVLPMYGHEILTDDIVEIPVKWWALASHVGVSDPGTALEVRMLHWLQDNLIRLQGDELDRAREYLETLEHLVG